MHPICHEYLSQDTGPRIQWELGLWSVEMGDSLVAQNKCNAMQCDAMPWDGMQCIAMYPSHAQSHTSVTPPCPLSRTIASIQKTSNTASTIFLCSLMHATLCPALLLNHDHYSNPPIPCQTPVNPHLFLSVYPRYPVLVPSIRLNPQPH